MDTIWGIDLGGTKIEGVVAGRQDAEAPLFRQRIPTGREKGYGHIISRVVQMVERMKSTTGLSPTILGIGTPGALDPDTGLLRNSNTTCLNGRPLKRDLEEALGVPVRMTNDANCFALAETRLGSVRRALPDATVVFGVIMGTGVGGGIIVDGRVVHGRQGIAGEWGHNFLDASGGPCYCGRTGCVETIISGPALEAYYHRISGRYLRLPAIVAQHQAGSDPFATRTVERLLHFFGRGIAQVINILDPDAIVLGGGLGNIDLLYSAGVAEVRKNVFNQRLDTAFLRPALGDSAGVFGAALLT